MTYVLAEAEKNTRKLRRYLLYSSELVFGLVPNMCGDVNKWYESFPI